MELKNKVTLEDKYTFESVYWTNPDGRVEIEIDPITLLSP